MARRQALPPRRVMAWGRSVLASALAAGLASRSGIELEQVEATLSDALAALHRHRAQAVVCDLASVPAACILSLLAAQPHLSVVIVDPDAASALVLTSRRAPMRTIDDLVAALLDDGGGAGPVDPSRDPERRSGKLRTAMKGGGG